MPITALAFVVREKFLPVIELDEHLIAAATDITRDNPWLRTVLIGWQEATQPRVLYVFATIVCIVVWRKYGLRSRALWAFATMMVAWALQLALKEVVHRARPVVSAIMMERTEEAMNPSDSTSVAVPLRCREGERAARCIAARLSSSGGPVR